MTDKQFIDELKKIDNLIEVDGLIDGTLAGLKNTSGQFKISYSMYQALQFKKIYEKTLYEDNGNLENKVLFTLLSIFNLDNKLVKQESISALNIVRAVTMDPSTGLGGYEWTYDDVLEFINDEDTNFWFKGDMQKIKSNFNECKKIIPTLIKYSISMALIDGEVDEKEYKYIKELEVSYKK